VECWYDKQVFNSQLTMTTIWYDTIRYSIFTCTQRLTGWPALSSARHRNKEIRKSYTQKLGSSEKRL